VTVALDDPWQQKLFVRVGRILSELVELRVTPDRWFTFRSGSVDVMIMLRPMGEWTVLDIQVPLLVDAPPTDQLYRFVATYAGYWFGHPSIRENAETATASVWLTHALLADYLDREELLIAVRSISAAAADLDEMLQREFGGRRFGEDA
jgi:hypothetical protein